MAISTDKNTNYGGALVNQKYTPLANISIGPSDTTYCSQLMTNRVTLLRSRNRWGRTLRLITPNWDQVKGKAAHRPPLVVISSNRSNWIKQGLEAAAERLSALKLDTFENVSDLRALSTWSKQQVSPPIYAPVRVNTEPNKERNIYIVVHVIEYITYKKALDGTGITPVGWDFATYGDGPLDLVLVGFGASRFAAMEFCKYLRRQAAPGGPAPWDYAWLVDDNVVALGNFAGFGAVEAALGNAVCAGFAGGTKALEQTDNAKWAIQEIDAGRGRQVSSLPKLEPQGIVQQMSLWNVKYLDEKYLNFSPIYIASAEDLSFSNYFTTQKIPYLFYKGISVRKELAGLDGGYAAKALDTFRSRIVEFVTTAEDATTPPGTQPPPPVEVDGRKLSEFVVNEVLPHSLLQSSKGNIAVQNTAKCQAVEQITSVAISKSCVTKDANASVFLINGDRVQDVEPVNVP